MADLAANIAGGFLRFAVFMPVAAYEGLVQNHWKVISDHPELQNGLYSSAIPIVEGVAKKWGHFAMVWSYAAWIPAVFIPAPLSLVFGTVDALIAGYLAYSAHAMTTFIPTSLGACKGNGPHEFRRPPGANESFFDAAGRLNDTTASAYQMCATFVQEYQYAIAVSSVYAAIAFINVAACIHVVVTALKMSKRDQKSFSKALLHNSGVVLQIFLYVLAGILYVLPAVLFRCLPLPFKSRVRLARRYRFKAGQALGEKGEMVLKDLTKRGGGNETSNYQTKDTGDITGLAEFLSIYDMAILVVKELHYVDLVHLGLVSRGLRAAILPSDAYMQRMVHFRMYSCSKKSKGGCWVCKTQICKGCRHSRALRQTTPYFHLDSCSPYCTQCYYKQVHQSLIRGTGRIIPPNDPRHCQCAPVTPTPNLFQRFMFGSARYSRPQASLPCPARHVCRDCNLLTDSVLLEKRLKRTKWELKKGFGVGERCKSCQGSLGSGPRWWVCRLCRKECRSPLHGAWGSRPDERRRSEVGERAV